MKTALGVMLTAILLLAGLARAAGPATFTYSGFLADSGGRPVTSASALTFRLYAAPSGGTPLFTSEAITVAPGSDGFFSAVVGSGVALPATAFDAPAFLSVQYGSEAEMSPRVALTSVPSAFSARAVDWAAVANRPDSSCSGPTPFVVGVGADGLAKCAAAPGGAAGCSSGQVLAWSGSAWVCTSAPTAGAGLTSGPSGALAVDTGLVQARVSGQCGAGSAIRVIGQDGSVACQAVGGGTVTSVGATANGGLVVTGSASAAPTLGLQPCGSGHVLRYDTSTSTWACDDAYMVSASAPLAVTRTSASASISMPAAGPGASGYLAAADFATFAGKPSLGPSGGLAGTSATAARSDHAHAQRVQVAVDTFRPFWGSPTAGTVTLGNAVLPGYRLSGTAGVGFVVTAPSVPTSPTVRWTLYNPGASSVSLSLRVAATGIGAGSAPPTCAWGGPGYPAPVIDAGRTSTISVTIGSNYTDVCGTPRVPIAAGDLLWIALDGLAANATYWVLAADVTF